MVVVQMNLVEAALLNTCLFENAIQKLIMDNSISIPNGAAESHSDITSSALNE